MVAEWLAPSRPIKPQRLQLNRVKSRFAGRYIQRVCHHSEAGRLTGSIVTDLSTASDVDSNVLSDRPAYSYVVRNVNLFSSATTTFTPVCLCVYLFNISHFIMRDCVQLTDKISTWTHQMQQRLPWRRRHNSQWTATNRKCQRKRNTRYLQVWVDHVTLPGYRYFDHTISQ